MRIVYDLWESVERKLRAWKVGLVAVQAIRQILGQDVVLYLIAIQRGVGRDYGGFINWTIRRVNTAFAEPVPINARF